MTEKLDLESVESELAGLADKISAFDSSEVLSVAKDIRRSLSDIELDIDKSRDISDKHKNSLLGDLSQNNISLPLFFSTIRTDNNLEKLLPILKATKIDLTMLIKREREKNVLLDRPNIQKYRDLFFGKVKNSFQEKETLDYGDVARVIYKLDQEFTKKRYINFLERTLATKSVIEVIGMDVLGDVSELEDFLVFFKEKDLFSLSRYERQILLDTINRFQWVSSDALFIKSHIERLNNRRLP